MFIGMLNDEQQDALCRIAQFLSKVDGVEDHREEALTAALLEESRLDAVPPAAEADDLEGLLERFDTPTARHAALLESLGVVLADQVITHEEMLAIDLMAKKLEVEPEWVERARDFVQRTLEIQREGRELLG